MLELQPYMLVGAQEVIVICVPEGRGGGVHVQRYNRQGEIQKRNRMNRERKQEVTSEDQASLDKPIYHTGPRPGLRHPRALAGLGWVTIRCQQLSMNESGCCAGGARSSRQILEMTAPLNPPSRSGLLIVFFPSAALCLTSCD